MEMTQTPAGPLSPPLSPGLPAPGSIGSRFHGDGVRYKAKLIGIDHVSSADGEKMCWDSMMKLKGFEAAFRKQGRHKQRVWLKIVSDGVRLLDERTGSEMYTHDKTDISAVTKDESDLRALAYVYRHLDNYYLFYLRMANLAEHVLNDIREVCQTTTQQPAPETPQQSPPQSSALFVLEEASSPPEAAPLENVFSPRPDTSSDSKQESSSSELMQVFSVQMEDPLKPDICPSAVSDPEPQPVLEPPKPALSKNQILSMFVPQPGGAVYTASPWAQQGIVGNQWAVPAAAPWPSNVPVWPAAPPTGHVMNNTGPTNNANEPQSPTPQNSHPNLLM